MDGITLEQRNQVDEYLNDQLGLTPDLIGEVAGSGLAALAWQQLHGSLISDTPQAGLRVKDDGQSIGIVAGSGRTGAVALVAARRLLAWGARPTVHLGRPRESLSRLNQSEVDRLELLGVRVFEPGAPLPAVTLWIDGLFGTGFQGELDEQTRALIDTVNHDRSPVLAIDLPSGLDAASGRASLPAIRADVTAALGLPMVGVLKPFATQLVGELLIIDLGIPASVWRRVGVSEVPSFDGRAFTTISN